MSIAYQYDMSGYFAGTVEDYGLLPNNATYVAPKAQKGRMPRWNGKVWVQVENHKGKEGYVDGQPFTIKEYGPLPEGWSDTPPPPALQEQIQAFTAKIQNRLDAFAKTGGYDGIAAAVSYALSKNSVYKAEGQYAADARDNTWEWANARINAMLDSRAVIADWADFEAGLEAAVPLVWPETSPSGAAR